MILDNVLWYCCEVTVSPRRRRGEARRAELLDGLVELFLSQGFLRLGVEDLAAHLQCSKTTLYAVAPSKEQLQTAVVRAFFRRSTAQVEERLAQERDPVSRIHVYLEAISEALAPATASFFTDVNEYAPAREIYLDNTMIAARRVQELVTEAKTPGGESNAVFIGAVAATVMASIQAGELKALTGLDDATAYQLLARLIAPGNALQRGGRATEMTST